MTWGDINPLAIYLQLKLMSWIFLLISTVTILWSLQMIICNTPRSKEPNLSPQNTLPIRKWCGNNTHTTQIVTVQLDTGWKFRGSNPEGGEIFRTRPDRPLGPSSLLYNGYRVSFPGVKRSGCGVDHPPPSSAEFKERVELYLHSPLGFHGLL